MINLLNFHDSFAILSLSMDKYAKYLNRQMAAIASEHAEIIRHKNDISISDILNRSDINRLLDKGNHDCENGFRRLDDGSVYVAVCTDMPDVTVEMINWWFWWHAAEDIRYQIWYPDMHFAIQSDFQGHYNDDLMTYAERLQMSRHIVTENIGVGREELLIDFMSPKDFGFDVNKINTSTETIICARVGSPDRKVWATEICHYVRTTERGVEMRSRFWIGYDIKMMTGLLRRPANWFLNQPLIKKSIIPKQLPVKMFYHCSQEYHHLASILPDLYKEES